MSSSAENVHHKHRFKNRAAYLLKTFIDINITCLGFLRRVLGENFQAPHKQGYGFCDSSLFLDAMNLLDIFATPCKCSEAKNKLAVT